MGLEFTCTQCGKSLITRYLAPGEVMACYHCAARVLVPSNAAPSNAQPPPPSTWASSSVDQESATTQMSKAARMNPWLGSGWLFLVVLVIGSASLLFHHSRENHDYRTRFEQGELPGVQEASLMQRALFASGIHSEKTAVVYYDEDSQGNILSYQIGGKDGGRRIQKTGSLRWRIFQKGLIRGDGTEWAEVERTEVAGYGTPGIAITRMDEAPLIRFSLADPTPFMVGTLLLLLAVFSFATGNRHRRNATRIAN